MVNDVDQADVEDFDNDEDRLSLNYDFECAEIDAMRRLSDDINRF